VKNKLRLRIKTMPRYNRHDDDSSSNSDYHRKRRTRRRADSDSEYESALLGSRNRRRDSYSDGSGYERRYNRRKLVTPELSSDDERHERRRGSNRRNVSRHRNRERGGRDNNHYPYKMKEGIHESYMFQYGRFKNVVQLMYLGIVGLPPFHTNPEYPDQDKLRRKFYDDGFSNERANEMEESNDQGRRKVHLMNERMKRGSFVLKLICLVMALVPVLEIFMDVLCIVEMTRPYNLVALLFFVWTCRNGLIGYFVHSCYLWPLTVSLQTVFVILVPAYWRTLPFVGHSFAMRLEIAAWAGCICWPVRMIMQCWIGFMELTSRGRLGDQNTHLLQMAVSNAIARPILMCFVKWIAWSKAKGFRTEYLVISGALALTNIWFIWLQRTTCGAERGVILRRYHFNVVHSDPKPIDMHKEAVTAVAWSPDDRTVLLGLDSGMLYELEAEKLKKGEGRPKHEWRGHDETVLDACFAISGDYAVSTGKDSKVIVWCSSNWRKAVYHDFHRDKPVRVCEISYDLRHVATGADEELCIWEWDKQEGRASEKDCTFHNLGRRNDRRDRNYESIVFIGFNDTSDRVIVGGECGSFLMVSLREKSYGDKIWKRDGLIPHIVVKGVSGFLTVRQKKSPIDIWGIVCCIETATDTANAIKKYEVWVYDIREKEIGFLFKMSHMHDEPVGFLAMCRDRRHCISSGRKCNVWSMVKGTIVGSSKLPSTRPTEGIARCGAVSPNGRWVALGVKSGQLFVIDFRHRKRPKTLVSRS